jgi:A nuclease of the HNH/ENDO VII superfamily with conserved WHH
MTMATIARQAAEMRLLSSAVDSLLGDGAAAAAIDAADAAYRAAEIDLHEAERREKRATIKLHHAEDDLKEARADGREAADDAEMAGLFLQMTLQRIPGGVLGTPGMPSAGQIAAAGHVPKEDPKNIPISEQEPPENWPGFMKSWFKIGRGEWTAIAGTAGLAKKAYDDPEKIPGAFGDLASQAYHEPLGTTKALVGYDELANGRWEDWFGQMGLGFLAGGGGGAVASRTTRLPRIVGPPALQPVGRFPPVNGAKFAGGRFDFNKPDLGARSGFDAPKIDDDVRQALADKYPNGVRYTRAGYPVFTPYAEKTVVIDNLAGDRPADFARANEAIGVSRTPRGYVWHHVEDGRTLELVPKDLHEAVRHTGGVPAIKSHQVGQVAPGGVFTPFEQTAGIGGGIAGFGAGGPAAAQTGP